ncbi:MAG: gamma-glutamyltransferase [Gammaproteobacteria bacterium]|nr:gamma-glutamyltransferase [Gammaproteobacteria bacterium]MDH4310527.1 gamma-glutamyltransferase [Gammaproteobacteria bacterium]MDH5271491.1 gamma-glutamyltransferase [Gammaproteobacteria bacterium]
MSTVATPPANAQAYSPTVARSIAKTQKPPLHGRHWMAITGKPLGATAGAMMFQRGGNAVDAACAMIAATSTMWDVLHWGGETQALIYDPRTKKVIAINGLGMAPTGATPEFFRGKGYKYPPAYGPLAAVTPGTPGGIILMLQDYGTLSLAEVLAPAIELADGYPIDGETADLIERWKDKLKEWPYSRQVLLPHLGSAREAPRAGEIFRQPDLAATLRKMVDAEKQALAAGKTRKEALQAAYDRFYRGDIAQEFVRGVQEQGGLITLDDLARWQPLVEEPLRTNYRGVDVYKLDVWTQGPALLQSLNILENFDVRAMGYNSANYVHTLYQAMNLAFADRDFYYGDPYFPPVEPTRGLLSKEYAKQRAATIRADRNDANAGPGDPYPFQGGKNPYAEQLQQQRKAALDALDKAQLTARQLADFEAGFRSGTTTVMAADANGWLVSVTPSGGWVPATIAGRTGVGLSQRMQSFVLDPAENPFNVLEPGKRPRVTLTPSLALKNGRPWLAFGVQGGDSQDQNLLQFFLNVQEFGMTVQEAAEAANFNSYQMKASFDQHESQPGRIVLNSSMPQWVTKELIARGYKPEFEARTSGPINAIMIDPENGTFWGGSSNHGEDYGIGW